MRLIPTRFVLVALVLAGLALVACSRGDDSGDSASDIDVRIEITPDPPAMGPATIDVLVSDSNGDPVTGATFDVVGDMTHAGMQPVETTTEEAEPGRYRTTGFEFTMAGDWIITVTGSLDDGTTIDRTFNIDGV